MKTTQVFKFNPTRNIANNLIGKEHGLHHRMWVGVIIMGFGVGITKLALITHFGIVHFLADGVGYLLHGIGAIPFAEWFINKNKSDRL